MRLQDFKAAFNIAVGDEELSESLDEFDGFAMPGFQPVTVTTRQVAALMRWQALQFNGRWDSHALNTIRQFGRRRFVVV